MQENVLASSSLIVNSYQELNRAIFAAGTTLENAINAFNQLNHTKFLENVSNQQRREGLGELAIKSIYAQGIEFQCDSMTNYRVGDRRRTRCY
jgi:hypothetical protein